MRLDSTSSSSYTRDFFFMLFPFFAAPFFLSSIKRTHICMFWVDTHTKGNRSSRYLFLFFFFFFFLFFSLYGINKTKEKKKRVRSKRKRTFNQRKFLFLTLPRCKIWSFFLLLNFFFILLWLLLKQNRKNKTRERTHQWVFHHRLLY
jgi:hypothetical protein